MDEGADVSVSRPVDCVSAEDLLSRYEALINQHDFDLLAPLISREAVFWFNDGSHSGLADIRRAFEVTWMKFPLERYWLEDLRWLVRSQGAAGCTYRFCWQATKDGKVLSGSGRGTTLLRQEADAWRIVHEHLSPFPR